MFSKPVLTAIYTITPPLLATIIGLLRYKIVKTHYLYLFIFVVFATFSEIGLNLYSNLVAKETRPLLHFYIMIEFLLLSIYFMCYLTPLIKRKFFLVVIVLFEIYCVINVIFIQGLLVYPNFVRAAESLLLMIFAVIFYYKLMIEANIKKLSREPVVWFNTALIIYFSTNFFFNILFNSILEMSREFLYSIAKLYSLNNGFLYILIAIGFWKSKENPEVKCNSGLI